MELAGAVAVITGGASGLGAETGKRLAQRGVKVVLGDMNAEAVEAVAAEIRDAGGHAIGMACNVTVDEDVAALMDRALSEYGKLNIVFANAGIIADSLMISPDRETGKVKRVMATADFRKVIDVNLTGAFITLREAAARMVDGGWPGLLAVTSSVNKVGQVGQINYASTKAAVAMWPKLLSAEFHMKNIRNVRVIAIAPGYAATPILTGMNQDALKAILADVHMQRLVEPAEIADTIAFAAENEAIDATCIEVTGGLTHGPRAIAK